MIHRKMLTLTLVTLSLLAGPALAEAKPAFGLADNTVGALKDPRFQASGIKRVRILIHYDAVSRGGKRLAEMDEWFKTAKEQGVEPLVTWYRTEGCSPKCAAKRLPSVSTYIKNVRKFRKRYPWVKRFSTFNEINFPAAEPTGRNPKRAAQYYRALRKECRGGRCSVLTGDFRANGSKFSADWLKTFKKHMGPGPHTWGLVPHPEINAFHTRYTKQFLKLTGRGNVWAVEAGAVNFFRPTLKPSLTRQTKAMKFLMQKYVKVSRRVKRIYMYHWQAAPNQSKWDSALLNVNGTPRDAYYWFFKGMGKEPPPSPPPAI